MLNMALRVLLVYGLLLLAMRIMGKREIGQLSNLDGKTDFATVNRRLSEIEKELTTLNQLWEQAASELAYYEAE